MSAAERSVSGAPAGPSACSGKVLESVVWKRAGSVTYRGRQRRIKTVPRFHLCDFHADSEVEKQRRSPASDDYADWVSVAIITESLDLINTEFKRLKKKKKF